MSTNLPTDIERLNLLPASEAEDELLKCCGSKEWAQLALAQRPFENITDLLAKSDRIWWALDQGDWLEAFHSHPRIGEKKAGAKIAPRSQQWSEDEQSGISNSARETIEALAELNRVYEEKFGYIFIVCASGKSSEEMLAILRERLANDPEEELRVAAAEQAKITRLRLRKLIDNQ
ncbi:MAG TPA: 2-oxo-4-hydroxy-4-carboxy-5-ureidoimidazoline decarboxylase [Pyrinomonadaceae bacterium]|nr:2-oxo-4-hydroxy-4-carboxy-5-ureidoimidazoline decarboxylase [Pyrinomonadaceae bacterium]